MTEIDYPMAHTVYNKSLTINVNLSNWGLGLWMQISDRGLETSDCGLVTEIGH